MCKAFDKAKELRYIREWSGAYWLVWDSSKHSEWNTALMRINFCPFCGKKLVGLKPFTDTKV